MIYLRICPNKDTDFSQHSQRFRFEPRFPSSAVVFTTPLFEICCDKFHFFPHRFLRFNFPSLKNKLLVASQTTDRLLIQQLLQVNNKENDKAPYYWSSVRGIHWWPVDCPHKG